MTAVETGFGTNGGDWGDPICVRVTVHGRVTGVGFRYSAVMAASKYPDIRGYVRNCDSRTVECMLQGDPGEVQRMVDWLRHGPPGARVAEVELCRESVKPYLDRFRIVF